MSATWLEHAQQREQQAFEAKLCTTLVQFMEQWQGEEPPTIPDLLGWLTVNSGTAAHE